MAEKDSLKWCADLKDGLKIVEPDGELAKSYLEQAKSSLERAEKNLFENDLLWASVVRYYAEYYTLYSFLQRIGVKCENHYCSILAVKTLLGENKVKTINEHKSKRIDAQYYMKLVAKEKIEEMLKQAKRFVSEFDNLVSELSKQEVEVYREKLKSLIVGIK